MGPVPTRVLNSGFRPLLVAGAAAALCACASPPLTPPPVAESPVSRQVEQASRAKGAYPDLRDIPGVPTDIRPSRAWSTSIYDMVRLRRVMLIEAAMAGPPPADTEAWTAEQRARAAGVPSAAAARTNTFVEGGRERATPPSPAP